MCKQGLDIIKNKKVAAEVMTFEYDVILTVNNAQYTAALIN